MESMAALADRCDARTNPNPSPSPNPNPNPNPTLTLTLTLTRCDARSLEEVPTFASVAEQLEAPLPAGLPGAGAP